MANRLFGSIPANRPKRNAFDLSFYNNLSLNFGELVPILCKEVVPGDKFRINSEAVIRMAPMLAPIMGQVDCYIHYFFVPNRIIWSNWEKFITGGITGDEYDGPYVPPYIPITDDFISDTDPNKDGSLYDYLGYPYIDPSASSDNYPHDPDEAFHISALPFRAYQLIYQEYYADELLYSDGFINIDADGNELLNESLPNPSGISTYNASLFTLRYRSWGKDYFTTARPQPALGGDVYIPVSGTGDFTGMEVSGTGIVDWQIGNHNPGGWRNGNGLWIEDNLLIAQADNGDLQDPRYYAAATDAHWDEEGGEMEVGGSHVQSFVTYDPSGSLKVDGSDFEVSGEGSINVTAGTIRDLNRAIALQKFNERSSVAGNRYIEFIKAHFGVVSSDARLQRPQYIGGVKTPVMISEVLQTAGSDYSAASGKTATPQGNMSGHGFGVAKSRSFKFFAEEYGLVMGIMSIIPKTSYHQGVAKMLTKFDRFDYYMPEFANIGEQEVKAYELYTELENSEADNRTFGYQSRFAEYKFSNNEVHGEFRSSLSYWHLGRIFSSRPYLNQAFVQVNPAASGMNRIFAVTSNAYDHFYCEIFNNIKAVRPMPVFGSFSL